MKTIIRDAVRRALKPLGQTTISIAQTYEANRHKVFARRGIDLVIDVGANIGQYAACLRSNGYAGNIISVEPLPDAYAVLAKSMIDDSKWSGHQAAAGAEMSTARLNVSADSVCSSLLLPSKSLTNAIKTAYTVKTIEVPVITLDSIELPENNNLALKLDVQGFEKQAMQGAPNLISNAAVLEIELSVQLGYEGAYSFREALPDIWELGFNLVSIGRGFSDLNTGNLIDIDVLFERR